MQCTSPEKVHTPDNKAITAPRLISIAGISNHPFRYQDDVSFLRRAGQLTPFGYDKIEVCTAQELENILLAKVVQPYHSVISGCIIFCHGDSLGLFFQSGEGLYVDDLQQKPVNGYGGGKEARFIHQIQEQFRQSQSVRIGIIVLLSCAGGAMAQALSNALCCKVVAAAGGVAPVVVQNKETGAFYSENGFYLFKPEQERIFLQDTIYPHEVISLQLTQEKR
jgi:hypothetical protein